MSNDGIDYLDEVVDAVAVDAASPAPSGEPCGACGCPVELGDRFCPACGAQSVVVAELAADPAKVESHKFFQCDGCGSRVATDPDQRSYICPFCDSTYVVEYAPAESGRQGPEFIVGFAVTPEVAQEKFRQWIASNRWFRPGDLKSARVADKMKGVYLPFWSFSMLANSGWRATIGEYWYRTETYTTTDSKGKTVTRTRTVRETEWWPLRGRHHRYYSGYLVSGSRGLSQQDADGIKPFQLPALKRYEAFYLAGWYSEEYSIDREQASKLCQQEFHRWEQTSVARFLPGDTHRGVAVQTQFSHVNSDLCLLPVYVLTYRYKGQMYRFLVNGQTGKNAGDKPVSWTRIGSAIAAGVVLLVIVAVMLMLLFGGL